jgi:hypothetical protein
LPTSHNNNHHNNNCTNNLFFAEEGFAFFSKRNFNTALTYLLGHVQDLTRAMVQISLLQQQRQQQQQEQQRWVVSRPPTRAIVPPPPPPYEINETAKTIGGIPLTWIDEATSATYFTNALRYLLTNIKHLMVMCADCPPDTALGSSGSSGWVGDGGRKNGG